MSPKLTAAYPGARLTALCRSGQAGFTLVELVMVIVLLGILSVYAAPRILNSGDFYARGFHDQSMAYLRYAQKTAIAQRRAVCVTLSDSAISLRIANAAGSNTCTATSPTGPLGTDLAGPAGEGGLSARSGVAFSSTPISFNFDALGQPVDGSTGALAATQILQVVNVNRSITIEAVTGYVHE
ncbi:MAG: prepilin-type N-terminal cleavage/methylation domain-containing protein [Betaproteobacteria bacterium]|nr:prepilin-type N-terminal cleavage/methylation domain-containing protein [Betaproteobacteria bacterium]